MYASLDYTSPFSMMPVALVSAIYAIASCIDRERPQPPTPNTIVQRYPEPHMFFEETLELLQLSSNKDQAPKAVNALTPSIDACQALVILSLQQHGLAEYSRAAILCGLASAMAIELRLHRAYESNDALQIEIQSRLWWNLFILEKMMSCEMGRPIILRSEETDCPFPSTSEADEFELMSTYPRFQGPYSQAQNTSIKLRTLSGLHTTIRLSKIMERISREIYGLSARLAIRENQDLGESKRREIWSELNVWENRMDISALAIDLSENLTSIPAVITNYVVSELFEISEKVQTHSSSDHVLWHNSITPTFHSSVGSKSRTWRFFFVAFERVPFRSKQNLFGMSHIFLLSHRSPKKSTNLNSRSSRSILTACLDYHATWSSVFLPLLVHYCTMRSRLKETAAWIQNSA
jgi:hypothetical protein